MNPIKLIQPILLASLVLGTWLYPRLSYFTIPIVTLVFLIKFLNSFVKRDPTPFSPIHKNETPFSAFLAYFGSKIDRYTIDEHKITTSSGHILTTFRINLKDKSKIPENFHSKPVLLSHGYMSSCDSFFITGDDRSLGYWFANKGYDVWVTNMRGNRYSHSHTNPDIAPADYFNYSIDDHARDIRHWYEKIIEVSGRDQILYVGYSMGCMMGAMAHSDPELKKYLDKHTTQIIFLAPYLFGSYSTDMAKAKLCDMESCRDIVAKGKEQNVFNWGDGDMWGDQTWKKLMKWFFAYKPEARPSADIFMIDPRVDTQWWDIGVLDFGFVLMPFLKFFGFRGTRHMSFSGSSIYVWMHMRQFIASFKTKTAELPRYNFMDKDLNLKAYGQEEAPFYPLENIVKKIDLIVGGADTGCNMDAALDFAARVNWGNKDQRARCHLIDNWKHLTFIAARNPAPMITAIESALSR